MKTRLSYPLKAGIIVMCCFLFAVNGKAQYVTIPDTAFVSWLNANGFSQCMNGNQMDTTCPAIVNATAVDCHSKHIANITGIEYFDNLQNLNCGDNNLAVIPPLSPRLYGLDCSYNELSDLPVFSDSLISINISGNLFVQVPLLPGGVIYLSMSNNQITSLSQIPHALWEFYADNNPLGAMPFFPLNLKYFSCINCDLTSLPNFNPNIISVNCSNNSITALPAVTRDIYRLTCSNNPITFDTLPATLNSFACNQCGLDSLPPLPAALRTLECNYNQLTALPLLPVTLDELKCSHNNLDTLPVLPAGLTDLDCSYNLLTSLPELPAFMTDLKCRNNADLFCLPKLTRIWDLDFRQTGISCLPNYGQVSVSKPVLSSLPLCSATGIPCPSEYAVGGFVYNDVDASCSLTASDDSVLKNVKVNIYRNNNLYGSTYSTSAGINIFSAIPDSTYRIQLDTAGLPFGVTCPDSAYYEFTPRTADTSAAGFNFALQCKSNADFTFNSINAIGFRPGNTSYLKISAGDKAAYYSGVCGYNIGGTVTLTITGPVLWANAAQNALPPTSNTGNVITWQVANLGAIDWEDGFNMMVMVDSHAQLGSTICFRMEIVVAGIDGDTTNNVLNHCFIVVAAYDPNDKQVYPDGNIDTTQKWLTYTIRFQNTGTAEAQFIHVDDTLDAAHMDVSSFQLLAYSHEPIVQIWESGAVHFNFPNINLPDSNTNESGSHGYVQYKIKLKEGQAYGTQIENTAFIYFDYNPPVVTNTTLNTLACPGDTSYTITASICAGDTFAFGNHRYAVAGNYTDTLQNVTGCDSVINLVLDVMAKPSVNMISKCGISYGSDPFLCGFCQRLLASVSDADSIVWRMQGGYYNLDTSFSDIDSFDISGNRDCTYDQIHVIRVDYFHNYTVCLTAYNRCGGTTLCKVIDLWAEGINELPTSTINIHPNPATNQITITTTPDVIGGSLTITDIIGRTIVRTQLETSNLKLETTNYAAGLYFVTLTTKQGASLSKKLVIEK